MASFKKHVLLVRLVWVIAIVSFLYIHDIVAADVVESRSTSRSQAQSEAWGIHNKILLDSYIFIFTWSKTNDAT